MFSRAKTLLAGCLDAPIILCVTEDFILRLRCQRCRSIASQRVQKIHVDRVIHKGFTDFYAEVVALDEVEPVAIAGGRLVLNVRCLALSGQPRQIT